MPLTEAATPFGSGGTWRLVTRLPGLEPAVPAEDIAWREDMHIGGPRALPVRWS
ncbi:hypothetical protein ABT288_22630 [Streptomyces sp. NPDC001093]|uniref:hypothetical protein n=1 Tax=Streptomyces sp. NPDC001093 TaxID=3154376 RepID=UPI00331EF7E2